MKSIFNKTNAPYLVAGTLATLASLPPVVLFSHSFVFYLNFGHVSYELGCLLGCAVLSTVIISMLSANAIIKNNIISEQKDQIASQAKKNERGESQKTIPPTYSTDQLSTDRDCAPPPYSAHPSAPAPLYPNPNIPTQFDNSNIIGLIPLFRA